MTKRIVLFLIVLLGLLIRLYNFKQLFHWSLDEEYWSYLILNIAKGWHYPLIGGNIGATGFHTTPWFLYLMAPLANFSNGNPLVFGYFSIIVSIITIISFYYVGSRLFSAKSGLLSSFIYAISTVLSIYDRRFWNPTLLPLIVIWVVYLVYRISNDDKKYWVHLSLLLTLAFSIHGLAVLLVMYAALCTWRRAKFNWSFVLGLIIFVLSFLPLVVFEVKHDFIQSRRFLVNIGNTKEQGNFVSATSYSFNALSAIFGSSFVTDAKYIYTNGCKNYLPIMGNVFSKIVILCVLFVSLYVCIRNRNVRSILLLAGLNLLGLFFWRDGWNSYYLIPAFVVFVLLSGQVFSYLTNKYSIVVPLILIIFAIYNVWFVANLKYKYNYVFKYSLLNRIILQTKNIPFNLIVENSDQCQNYGYRYIFTFLKYEPVSSYVDNVIGWLYDPSIKKISPEVNVILKDDHIEVEKIYEN